MGIRKKDTVKRIIVPKASHISIATEKSTGDKLETLNVPATALKYDELLENIYDAVLITDSHAAIVEINHRAVQFFECEADALIRMPIYELMPDIDSTLMESLMEMPASRYALIETRCRRKDETYFPAEVAVKSIGEHKNFISFFVRNISKRIASEARLRSVTNAIHNALTAIVITDTNGVIKYGNPSADSMFGGLDSIGNQCEYNIRDYFLERNVLDNVFDKLRSSRQWQGELTLRRYDGIHLNAEISAAPNREDEELVGYVFSILDITQQRRAQDTRRINEQNATTVATLATACHHLSQPATVLVINSELMETLKDSLSTEDMTDLIKQNSDAAYDLQRKLRDLNKVTLYRTEQYLEKENRDNPVANTILDIDQDVLLSKISTIG